MKLGYDEATPYTTKDGSLIRELAHPALSSAENLSLAEAVIEPGGETGAHIHRTSEEIYHFLAGKGVMGLGRERFAVGPGDTVVIAPGVVHWVRNEGEESMRILCCCSPAYAHEDTELVAEP